VAQSLTLRICATVSSRCRPLGAVISEGREIKMRSFPSGWRCHHRGDLDDPDFNNRHVEIGPE
jgi:hypothetical protein